MIKPRTLAVIQNLAGKIHSVKLLCSSCGYLPPDQKSWKRSEFVFPLAVILGHLDRLGHVESGRQRLRLNVAKIRLDQLFGIVRFKRSRQHEHCVVRCVKDAEKFLHILDRGVVEMLHRADRRVCVGKILKDHFVNQVENLPVRLIVVPQTLLFLDGLTLVIEILLRYRQASHPVGFEPQRERQLVRRQRLEIVRPLARRCAVHRAAGLHYVLKMPRLWHIRRPLEHHVLKQMSKPRAPLALVTRADIVIDRDRHDRYRVIAVEHNLKPVRKGVFLDRQRL